MCTPDSVHCLPNIRSRMAGKKPREGEGDRSWQWRFDRRIVIHTIPPSWALCTPKGRESYVGTRLELINEFYKSVSLSSSDFNLVRPLLFRRRRISNRAPRWSLIFPRIVTSALWPLSYGNPSRVCHAILRALWTGSFAHSYQAALAPILSLSFVLLRTRVSERHTQSIRISLRLSSGGSGIYSSSVRWIT